MNSYFVCLTISRRHISFEYYQEGADKPLSPFPGDNVWPAPLSLYCTPAKIEIGKAAERAASRGVQGAYKEWFKFLSSREKVSYLGEDQPISHLLLLAAEEQFRTFLREVRYNMDGTLENCRATLPLVLSFEDDVDDSMRIFLVNLFKTMGYARMLPIFHNRSIASYYKSLSRAGHVLIVDNDGVDVTVSFFTPNAEEPKFKRVILNGGSDSRIGKVCNMIWDKTGAEYSFLNRDAEQPLLEQMAKEIIQANKIEYEGIMNYSNGEAYSFMVSRSELLSSGSGANSAAIQINEIVARAAGIPSSDITLVIRNTGAQSDYLAQSLLSEFPDHYIHDEEKVEAVNRTIVNLVMPKIRIEKPSSPSPDPIFPDPGNKDNKLPPFTESEIIEEGIEILPITPVPAPEELDSTEKQQLNRKWREVRAKAKAKERAKETNEAIAMLHTFAKEIGDLKGLEDLKESIDREISKMVESYASSVTPPFPPRSAKPLRPEKKVKEAQTSPPPPIPNEGEELIRKNKLKEARVWYRNNRDNKMAGILNDIIRSKKSVDLRKDNLEEYRKSKDKGQISRIITEIQDFIDLCESAGVNSADYRKLLNEYRKI